MPNPDDFMSAVSGDLTNPAHLSTTTAFYHNELVQQHRTVSIHFVFLDIPALPFDSWVTIGLDQQPDAAAGEHQCCYSSSTGNPWVTILTPVMVH